MTRNIESRRRLLKLQKMRQEKAERDLAIAQRQKQTLASERAGILNSLEDGSVAERLFPKLTYDRLRSLETNLVRMDAQVTQMAKSAYAENKKLEKTRDAFREEQKFVQIEAEAKERSELIDLRSAHYGRSTGSGKIDDVD